MEYDQQVRVFIWIGTLASLGLAVHAKRSGTAKPGEFVGALGAAIAVATIVALHSFPEPLKSRAHTPLLAIGIAGFTMGVRGLWLARRNADK